MLKRGLITFNKPLSQKILPDLCSCWSSVKGIAGNGENLYQIQVLTSQATCFSTRVSTNVVLPVLRKSFELIDE